MIKTKDGRDLAVEELIWEDVVDVITTNNPDLAKIMRFVDNRTDFKFYKANYRFGDKIINDGECYLPLANGGSINFNDMLLPDRLRNNLYFNGKTEDPLGLILSKNSEWYLSGKDIVQPHSIIEPGQMFGIPRAIDRNSPNNSTSALELNLNAGNRSLFMLSKISDQIGHSKIQEHYGTNLSAPTYPQDHWNIFVDIANRANSTWRCEIIYFPRNWIDKLNSDEWASIAKHLMIMHRSSYNIWHKASGVWNKTFNEIEHEKKLIKNYPMLSINMAKQLFMFCANINLGFKPSTDESAAPVGLIVEAYTNVYNKLTKQNHSAILMETAKFNSNSKYPIYHSINHTNLAQDNLEASKNKSQIALLDEIRRIAEIYKNTMLDEKQHIRSLYEIAKNTEFTYYHSNPQNYNKIHDASLLASEDKRFTNRDSEKFPTTSQFFKGCIKINQR